MGLIQNLQRGILRPEARDDAYTIDENGSTTVAPLQNDAANYPLLPFARAIVYVDTNDFLGTVEVVDNRAHLKIDPGTAYDYLSEGETATATIIYGMQNALGYRDRAEITITITGQNDAPDAQDVDVLTTEAAIGSFSGPDGITITPVFTDPDANDTHTISIASTSGYASVEVNPDGTIQYYTGAFDFLVGEGETITDTFTYTVTDNHGASDTATVTLTIEGDNDAPVDFVTEAGLSPFGINTAGVVSVFEATDGSPEEGSTHSVQSTRADFFDDVNDTQTISVSFVGSELNNAASSIGALGTVSAVNEQPDPASPRHFYGIDIEVSDTALDFLGEGEVLRQTYDYTITDQHGASATYQFYAYFYGANDAPDAQDVGGTVGEDGPGVVIAADFTDPDVNDTHSFTIDTTGTLGSVVNNGDGTFTYDPNGQFEDLISGETATDTFTYTVDDGNGGTDTATVSVVIEGTNTAPEAVQDFVFTDEDTPILIDVLANDTDIDDDDNPSNFTLVSVQDGGLNSFSIENNQLRYDPTTGGAFGNGQGYLAAGEAGFATVVYTMADDSGATSQSFVQVSVGGLNDPVSIIQGSGTVLTGTVNELPEDGNTAGYINFGQVTFSDIDINDVHFASFTPQGTDYLGAFSFLVNAQTGIDGLGTARWDFFVAEDEALDVLDAGESITQYYDITITDLNGSTATETVAITINGENDAPNPVQDFVFTDEDTPILIDVLANDTDPNPGDNPSNFTLVSVQDGGLNSFSIENNQLRYDPTTGGTFGNGMGFLAAGETGFATVVYTMADDSGATSQSFVQVSVGGLNDPVSIIQGSGTVLTGTVNELPEDGNTAGYINSGQVLFSDIDLNDFHLASFTPQGTDYLGAFSFNVFAQTTIEGLGTAGWNFFLDNDDLDDLDAGESLTQYYDITISDGKGSTATETVVITINGEDEPVFDTLVIDFEDRGGLPLGDQAGDVYEGFVWQTSGPSYFDTDYEPDGDIEMTGFTDTMVMKRLDGTDFNLNRLELAAGTAQNGSFGNATSITITGKQNGATIISQTYTAGTHFDNLGMMLVLPGFDGVDQVEITGDGFFAIDNIEVEVQPTAGNTAPTLLADDMVTMPELETAVPDYSPMVTDPDVNDGYSYQIAGGADAAAFSINATTGALSFNTAPDFEAPADANGDNIYVVHVTATDLSGAVSNAEHVRVHITDVDPEPLVPQPLLLDFEDLGGQILGNGQPFYQGFTWSSPSGFGADDWDSNGDDEITGGINPFSFERTDGTDFDLTSFDLGQGIVAGDGFAPANIVTVKGLQDGSVVAMQTFTAGIDFDNTSMTNVFVGFEGVDEVVFETDGFYALDNLSTEVLA